MKKIKKLSQTKQILKKDSSDKLKANTCDKLVIIENIKYY